MAVKYICDMDDYSELEALIDKSERILVFTGAGISTSSGIPDFRGAEGLYQRVQMEYHLPYAEALFDLDYFHQNPRPFFSFSQELFKQNPKPSETHAFLADLESRGKIEMIVTQNIDMLHQKAGSTRVMECHGGYETGHCQECGSLQQKDAFWPAMIQGAVPHCSCGGVIKPDVVFFGENLPEEFYRLLENPPQGDLMLVFGTSLTVYPAAQFALQALGKMPSVLVNAQSTQYDRNFDMVFHEDLDELFGRFNEIR